MKHRDFCEVGVAFLGVLMIRVLLFGVHIRALIFWKALILAIHTYKYEYG